MSCANSPYYGLTVPVGEALRNVTRLYGALGKYGIPFGFDAWPGFQVEMKKFLAIAAMANNAAQVRTYVARQLAD